MFSRKRVDFYDEFCDGVLEHKQKSSQLLPFIFAAVAPASSASFSWMMPWSQWVSQLNHIICSFSAFSYAMGGWIENWTYCEWAEGNCNAIQVSKYAGCWSMNPPLPYFPRLIFYL